MTVNPCDNCLIKLVQFKAGSFVEGSSALASAYNAYTSSCSKTGFPITASPPPFTTRLPTSTTTPSTAPSAAPACGGSKYTIRTGDTCQSVSRSQRIGTAWLLFDNNLAAYCADFPNKGTLYIHNTCNTYTVRQNDTCKSIARAYNVSEVMIGLCKSSSLRGPWSSTPQQSV